MFKSVMNTAEGDRKAKWNADRTVLKTILSNMPKRKNSGSIRTFTLRWALPFCSFFLAVSAASDHRPLDFDVLWLFKSHSMILSGNLLDCRSFPLPIAPIFKVGVLGRVLRGYRWLWWVLRELLLFLQRPTCIIGIIIGIVCDLLIQHFLGYVLDAVNSIFHFPPSTPPPSFPFPSPPFLKAIVILLDCFGLCLQGIHFFLI